MNVFSRSRLLRHLAVIILSGLGFALSLTAADSQGQILGGSLKSPVRIEVFSDFQCAACREFYLGTIRQTLQEYSSKDRVCVIYHEFPLAGHRYSRLASQYAEAAGRLGVRQLLAVMDAIYMDQAKWSQSGRLEDSVSKALTREDFLKLKTIMQSPSINQKIDQDIQLALKQNIRSTPTIIIHSPGKIERAEGYLSYPVLKYYIDSKLK
jgi:protein-disulfide isomerase